jgi:lipoate-protein ligase A
MVRVVDSDVARPELTAAADEALLWTRIEGRCGDTVHLYRRRPPSVSLGRFQVAGEVVDLDACERDGVPVVRRSSGGGAIYTDDRQLVYALVWRPERPLRAEEGFVHVCGAIVRALARLGVPDARRTGVNDVVVRGRKVSGSAQAVRRGVHLVHGTVLVDADLDAMFTYLRPLPDKLERAGLRSARERVTTLAEVLGGAPAMAEVKGAVSEQLAAVAGGAPEPGGLTAEERGRAEGLVAERFSQRAWNLRR